jgi:major inositol transporter-like SP family MFS transporter
MSEVRSVGQSGRNRYVYTISVVAALGGMLFGYDTGVISGALLFIKKVFSLSPFMQGAVVSSLLVGATVGALVAGPLSDRFGRRPVLILAAIIFIVGALLAALTPNAAILIVARFVLGLAVGTASLLVPLYIAEMAPADVRGALVNFNQLMITVGILVSYLVGYALASAQGWRWMLGLAVVPAAMLGLGMLFLPETPRYLVSRHLPERARAVLRSIRSETSVEGELNEIIAVEEQERRESRGWDELLQPWVRPMLLVGVGLAVFSQITGINTIIYFAPSTFQATGFGASASILATAGVGVVLVVGTILAIMVIDRLGRRSMLLIAFAGMGVSLGLMGLAYLLPNLSGVVGWLAIACVTVYIAFFSFGLGAVIWVVVSEIYPLTVRGSGMAMATTGHWVANFVVSLTYLSLIQAIGETFTLWLYAVMCVGAFLFCYFLVPETKGRSLEEIEEDLREKAIV